MTATDRSRECKGCEGSGCGCVEKTMAVFTGAGASSEPCADCPACLGSGRVTDGPFRRDVEVDAETWRKHVAGRWRTGAVPLELDEPLFDLFFALAAGDFTAAARAAFRAVPGLRGE